MLHNISHDFTLHSAPRVVPTRRQKTVCLVLKNNFKITMCELALSGLTVAHRLNKYIPNLLMTDTVNKTISYLGEGNPR